MTTALNEKTVELRPVPPPPTREELLVNAMLRAISRINTALGCYSLTRDEWELIGGLIDVRKVLEEELG